VARRALLAVALCGALVLGTAAPAEASHGCGAARSKGARIVVKNREAVMFTKGFYYYGCLSSVGTVRRLPEEGGGIDIDPPGLPVLAGRYLAYSTAGSAIGDEFDRLYVYDLRAGRRFLFESSTFVRAIVLKRNGSVAWIETAPANSGSEQTVWDVRKWANEERLGSVLLDRGADVDPGSLALSADRNSVSWTRGEASRTAPLR
jgi:hypothetical protein